MKVWKLTIPPEYLHVQPESETTPVPDKYLNKENYLEFDFLIRKTQQPCKLFVKQNFYSEFMAQIEDLPRLDEEWIESYGVDQPTVIVIVYADIGDDIFIGAKNLADKFVTHETLPDVEAFDYL